MRINILQADQDKIVLRVRFTNKELIDAKFTVAMTELQKDTKLTITPPQKEDGNAYRVKRNVPANKNYQMILGKLVDDIREIFSGDVQYTYTQGLKDAQNNPLPDPKTYTKIPRFKVGETDKRKVSKPQFDEQGEPVLDQDGNQVMQEVDVELE